MDTFITIVFVALVGSGVWLLYEARGLIRLGLASYRWPNTEGTVIDSHDDSFTLPGIDSTGVGVRPVEYKETVHDYVYEVSGRLYRCNTYAFGGWAENATAAYAIGTKVTVYYDPERPGIAVLCRGLQISAVFGIVPLVAALLGLYFKLK